MKISKISFIVKKAPFPAAMTIITFVLFLAVYFAVTAKSIEPYYFVGLIFAVPFVCFGIITFLSVTNKLETVDSFVICYILILVLGFAALFGLIALSFDAATTVITDIGKYERVLKLTGYPKNKLTKYFPDKIPDNAKNIVFSYNYAFLQGGENFNLKFKTDSDYIEDYIYILSRKVKWTVNDSEVVKKNILSGGFYVFSYPDLPEDFTIYVIYSKPYHPGDFNHGELSLAVVSKKRNEIIFLAEDW